MVERLASQVSHENPIIISSDFNTWAEDRGSCEANGKGCILSEAFVRLYIILANSSKQCMESVIDLTTEEGLEAAKKIIHNKEADGIPNKALIVATNIVPKYFAETFTTGFKEGICPESGCNGILV